MIIDVDFTDVPDSVPQVEPGAYSFLIKAYEHKDAVGKKKATHSYQLQIEGTVEGSDTPMKGRIIFDDFPPEFIESKNHPVQIRFVQMLKSMGMPLSGGIDPASFVGKSVRGFTAKRTYESSGEVKEQAYVKQYLFNK